MNYPQVIEVSEISQKTIQSIRIVLVQTSISHFLLIIEALEAPEFKTYKQIKPAKQIIGESKAIVEYLFTIHQLRQIHYVD